jgi:adenine deaminase
MEAHLRICVEEGIDAITAVRMATLNAAECYHLDDRGGIAPGLRADIVIAGDLIAFPVEKTLIGGRVVAENGCYLLRFTRCNDSAVRGSFHVKDFSASKLRLPLKANCVYVIDVKAGTVVTGKGRATVARDGNGDFVYDPNADIAKIAVVERHQNTGNVAVALIRGFGIRHGAIALSIAHDSHNIITVGVNDTDITLAVETLLSQGGGIAVVRDGKVLEVMSMPLGGVMSDQSGEWVEDKLAAIHNAAWRDLGIKPEIEPVMTLCFMSLAVIPELKITDMGLFDVGKFEFIPVEA